MPSRYLEWYYVIFWLPAAVSVLVLLLTGASGSMGGHGHAGAHGGHSVGHGAHSAHHGHSGSHHHTSTGFTQRILALIGIGRAPITITLGSLMLAWGLVGLAVMQSDGQSRIALALPVAAVSALVFSRVVAGIAGKLIPSDESFAVDRGSLIGRMGTVVYPVGETEGRVHVFDQFGTLHVEPARAVSGGRGIRRGETVEVIALDEDERNLLVRPSAP